MTDQNGELIAQMQAALEPLDERAREVMRLRFGLDRGEPRTAAEVAEIFGLSEARINTIVNRAMAQIRGINPPFKLP